MHPDEAKPTTESATPIAYTIAVLCWLLSAGVYIAAKWVGPEMPPWTLCFARLLIACAILLPFVRQHYGTMIALLRSRALELIIVGALGLAFCQGLIYTGLNFTDATTAGIIMALTPVMTVVLAHFVLGETLGLWKALGALLALIGMMVIVGHGDISALLRLEFNLGELFIVAGALCFAIYTVLLRRAKFGLELMPLLVLLLAAGALTALPFFLWELLSGKHSALETNGLLALAYVAGPGGALMYYLYNHSVESLGAGRASMMLYLQTIFIAILAYLLLGESLHGYDLAGAAFIVAGLGLAAIKTKPPRADKAAQAG